MRQVEFTETVKIGPVTYNEGDRKSFEDDEAGQYIALGWGKDPETGETGERKPGSNGPLKVDPVVHKIG